jgi:dTDP-4-dehydrorhamnose 3,5-epimerase
MKIESVTKLALPEVKILRFARFPDERGYFTEIYRNVQVAEALGTAAFEIVQVNESCSLAGVIRGLHAQWNPWQGKMVRPLHGGFIDLALDIRKGSPNYGRIVAHQLRQDPTAMADEWIWVPPGFAHGVVFNDVGTIQYLCTSAWSPGCELSISPAAADLDWSLCDSGLQEQVRGFLRLDIRVNEKDRAGFTLEEWSADPRSNEFTYAPGEPFGIRGAD